jgi:hypothetical protein
MKRSFDEFFISYLREHRSRANRLLHASGTLLGIAVIAAAAALGRPLLALLWIPLGYGLAWLGHFAVERNRPPTFTHPWWSLASDFRMLGLMLSGRLGPWLRRANAGADGK